MTTTALLNPLAATYNKVQIDHINEERLESLTRYIDELFNRHATPFVIHLEATYRPAYRDLMIPTILEITKERFLDCPGKTSLLDGVIGYIWTANHIDDDAGPDGYTLRQHFLICFDASGLQLEEELKHRLIDWFDKISLGTATCSVVEPCLAESDDGGGVRNRRVKVPLLQRVRDLMGTNGSSLFGICVLASHAGERATFDRLRRLLRAGKLGRN